MQEYKMDEPMKDRMRWFIAERSRYLASVFDKYKDKIVLDYLPENTLGSRAPGKIILNVNNEGLGDIYKIIMTFFHEIGHELDKKSEYYYRSEKRARRFEYKVAKRLGPRFMSVIDEMTEAAGTGDSNAFGEMFHSTSYKRKVHKRRSFGKDGNEGLHDSLANSYLLRKGSHSANAA